MNTSGGTAGRSAYKAQNIRADIARIEESARRKPSRKDTPCEDGFAGDATRGKVCRGDNETGLSTRDADEGGICARRRR